MAGVRISKDNICAGRMGERGQGICQGDLGGPLFCRTDAGVSLVGVATNGAICGSPQHPGMVQIDGRAKVENKCPSDIDPNSFIRDNLVHEIRMLQIILYSSGIYLKTDGFIEWIQRTTKNYEIGDPTPLNPTDPY